MNEQEFQRQAKQRLAILRHAEEITGNVAATCRHYGIEVHEPVESCLGGVAVGGRRVHAVVNREVGSIGSEGCV